MQIPSVSHKGISFLNVNNLDPQQIVHLNKEFGFSILNLEDYLYKTQIPKIEVYDSYTLIVLDIPFIETTNTKKIEPMQKKTYQYRTF